MSNWNWQGQNTADVLIEAQQWHRGTAIAVEGMTLDQQLKAADLDWDVVTSGFRFGDKYQYRETDTQVAYRSDNGMFIATYTDRKPWQNREILDHFHRFCDASDLGVSHIGSLNGGKQIYAAAKLPVQADVLGCGDVTEYWLLLNDSHINGKGLQISLYGNRMACTNGLHELVRVGNRTIAHLGEFSRERVTGVLEAALAMVQQKQETYDRLAQEEINVAEASLQLIAAFGDPSLPVDQQSKVIQTALKLFQGQAKGGEYLSAYNTAYGLLQSVTEYFNHHAPQRGSNQTQFNSILSGSRGKNMAQFERQLVGVYCS
jgi:hypothetical protein